MFNCIDADTNSCSSISLKTKNLECCLVMIDFYSGYDIVDTKCCLPYIFKLFIK